MKITFIDIEGRASTIESSQVARCEKLDTKDRQAWRGIVERRDAKGICTSFGVVPIKAALEASVAGLL